MKRILIAGAAIAALAAPAFAQTVQLGPRPFFLVDRMQDGELKERLAACQGPFERTSFSIGHRGAPLMFPLIFFIGFAGGLSRVDQIPGFDYEPGYETFQFAFILLQFAAMSGVLPSISGPASVIACCNAAICAVSC